MTAFDPKRTFGKRYLHPTRKRIHRLAEASQGREAKQGLVADTAAATDKFSLDLT
jgi:hypothetical protein